MSVPLNEISQLRLLSLPVELKLQIYDYVLADLFHSFKSSDEDYGFDEGVLNFERLDQRLPIDDTIYSPLCSDIMQYILSHGNPQFLEVNCLFQMPRLAQECLTCPVVVHFNIRLKDTHVQGRSSGPAVKECGSFDNIYWAIMNSLPNAEGITLILELVYGSNGVGSAESAALMLYETIVKVKRPASVDLRLMMRASTKGPTIIYHEIANTLRKMLAKENIDGIKIWPMDE